MQLKLPMMLDDVSAQPAKTIHRRAKRPPRHDFKDGQGKVPAHRHPRGGGWVADTAYVAPTAVVTRNAEVYGFAKVYDECQIKGQSRVFGCAKLLNDAVTTQAARISGNAVVSQGVTGGNAVVCDAYLDNTVITGRVRIVEGAVVVDSRIYGPVAHFETLISEEARLMDATVRGLCQVSGGSHLVNGNLEHCRVHTATVVRSTLLGTSPVLDEYLYSSNPIPEGTVFQWANFECALISDSFIQRVPRSFTFPGALKIIHCDIAFWPPDDREIQLVALRDTFRTASNPGTIGTMYCINSTTAAQLLARLNFQAPMGRGNFPATNNTPAAGAPSPLPNLRNVNLDAVRQRRIMPIEETP